MLGVDLVSCLDRTFEAVKDSVRNIESNLRSQRVRRKLTHSLEPSSCRFYRGATQPYRRVGRNQKIAGALTPVKVCAFCCKTFCAVVDPQPSRAPIVSFATFRLSGFRAPASPLLPSIQAP